MRLFAPEGATEANIDGAIYKPDEDGTVEVMIPAHETTLLALGFTKTKPAPPADPTEIEADAVRAPASVLTIRVSTLYPAIAAALEAAGVQVEEDELPTDVLTLIERHLGEVGGFASGDLSFDLDREKFPFVAACLDDSGVSDFGDLDAVFAAIETRAPENAFNEDGSRKEFVIGDFVKGALEAAGLTDIADTQAVLDAIEDRFKPFAAFDPNNDGKPGGGAGDTDADEIPPEIDALKGPELKKQLEDLGVGVPSGTSVPKMKVLLRDELAKKAAEAAAAPGAGE